MDNELRKICRTIQRGKRLEESIPVLLNKLADVYYVYAGLQLAMNYYTLYQDYCDEEELWSGDAVDRTKSVNTFIREHLFDFKSGQEHEEAVLTIDAIRKDNMKRMDVLTAYTDIFQIYEYVLNRIEYKYKENPYNIDDEEFAREILRYVFNTEDNFAINEKIKEIIGQLPVRMTKQKYFDLLGQSAHAYKGAERDTFDTFLYMIRTSAMLHKNEDMDKCYPQLADKKSYLEKLQFKNLSHEEFNEAFDMMKAAISILEKETTIFITLQEIINSIYIILICYPYAGMSQSEEHKAWDSAFEIIRKVNASFIKGEKDDLSEEIADKLSEIEGIQEDIAYDLTILEDTLYTVGMNYKELTQSLMLDTLMQVLARSQKLNSDSIFIDLDLVYEEGKVDEQLINRELNELKEQLSAAFDSLDRMVCRAIMANTLNKMPVFFSNRTEVMDYVRYTIEHCFDMHEKAASYEIINKIMSE
ncbi:MAG: hypothetical protein GX757_08970 [Clostridiales bacterium]|nr:hypothetical protein [Clostridiales bacterium]